MSKQKTVNEAVAKTVELFESVVQGCAIIVDKARKSPELVDIYQPLLPVLKRLQVLVEKAIAVLERQPAAGREG